MSSVTPFLRNVFTHFCSGFVSSLQDLQDIQCLPGNLLYVLKQLMVLWFGLWILGLLKHHAPYTSVSVIAPPPFLSHISLFIEMRPVPAIVIQVGNHGFWTQLWCEDLAPTPLEGSYHSFWRQLCYFWGQGGCQSYQKTTLTEVHSAFEDTFVVSLDERGSSPNLSLASDFQNLYQTNLQLILQL